MFDIYKLIAQPKTLTEAVDYLRNVLEDEVQDQIRQMSLEEVETLQIGLGRKVRTAFGLTGANVELFTDCNASSPEDASRWILRWLWIDLKTHKIPKAQTQAGRCPRTG